MHFPGKQSHLETMDLPVAMTMRLRLCFRNGAMDGTEKHVIAQIHLPTGKPILDRKLIVAMPPIDGQEQSPLEYVFDEDFSLVHGCGHTMYYTLDKILPVGWLNARRSPDAK